MKTSESFFSGPLGGYKDKRIAISNEYFSFLHYGRFFDDNQFNLGIHLGVQWNNKHSVEFGVSRDQATVAHGISTHTLEIDTATNVRSSYESTGGGSVSAPLIRYSLSYQMILWKNNNNTMHLRGLVGFGFLHTRFSGSKDGLYADTMYIPQSNDGPPPPNDISIHEIMTVSYQRMGFSLNTNIGLGIDFISKKKQKNLFSVDIFYLHNFKMMFAEQYYYRVTDKLLTTDYKYFLGSRGSGFYFNISKKNTTLPMATEIKETTSKTILRISENKTNSCGIIE